MACSDTYLPKRTDLVIHTAEQLASLASVLNRRPRKFLGWASPPKHLDRLAYRTQIHKPFAPTAEIRP
jgi:IS30 family transposase